MKFSEILDDLDVSILRTLDTMRSRGERWPIRATAEALGLTQGRVRHRLFRAVHRLKGLSRFASKPGGSGMVPCPKCKGGCDLCGGRGVCPEGAARVYIREESRRTVKIPARLQDNLRWPSEPPTKPEWVPTVIQRARRVTTAARWVAMLILAVGLGALLDAMLRGR